jgi:hypothetical protein
MHKTKPCAENLRAAAARPVRAREAAAWAVAARAAAAMAVTARASTWWV